MRRISYFIAVTLVVALVPSHQGAIAATEPRFEVSVDRASIGMDESVALKFRILTDGVGGGDEPEFQAPDFDLVNQYSNVFVESYFENGRFGARNNRQVTKVLRPTRQGELTISGIQVRLGGKLIQHPPIKIQVVAGGQGTPPPPSYGGTGSGLRGAGKRASGSNLPFMIRAEVDHARVFKGQKVIVSYYLYQRVKVHNVQVDKYPVLDGFLREDLELPILGQRLTDQESVVLEGVPYDRVLLARYAAYPLKEGKLAIDSMAIKANYFVPPGGIGDSQDAISEALSNFMRQLQPRVWSHRNDPVEILVDPLPLDGRPPTFTGGVGDFELSSAVDRVNVKVNEPLTLVVKVEGRGNIGAIGQPSVKWPEGIEVYETKQKVTGSPGGVSSKIFEILLVPRKPGKIELPDQILAFFSPSERAYKVRKASGIEITVEGQAETLTSNSSGAVNSSSGVASGMGGPAQTSPKDGLLLPEQWTGRGSAYTAPARWLVLALVGLSGLAILGLATLRISRKRGILRSIRESMRRSQYGTPEQFWEDLKSQAFRSNTLGQLELKTFYQKVSAGIYSAIEARYALPARAWSRSEIGQQLQEADSNGQSLIEDSLWQRIENILEYAEAVQFSGAVSDTEARQRMEPTLKEVERIMLAVRATDR